MNKIAIKGAGVSGLWLSKCIKEHNKNIYIDIFEKNNKIGGRFQKENNLLLGAEIIHGEKSPFYNYVKKFNYDLIQLNDPIIISKSKYNNKLIDCHEYCMNIENYNNKIIKKEQKYWENNNGNNNYLIDNKLYDLIINDLSSYSNNIFLNNKLLNNSNYDLIINAYTPDKFIKKQYSAIKLFIEVDDLLNYWNRHDSYIYINNTNIIELWKTEFNNKFVIFATANRADLINEIYKNKSLDIYVKTIFNDIFNKNINVNRINVKYWSYGYHYPSNINKINFKENNFSCGEWIDSNNDSSINGAINTANKLFNKLKFNCF